MTNAWGLRPSIAGDLREERSPDAGRHLHATGRPTLSILRSETRPVDHCLDCHRFRKIVGGVSSLLLSNLYLNEVDKMLERGVKETTRNGKYTYLDYALCR